MSPIKEDDAHGFDSGTGVPTGFSSPVLSSTLNTDRLPLSWLATISHLWVGSKVK